MNSNFYSGGRNGAGSFRGLVGVQFEGGNILNSDVIATINARNTASNGGLIETQFKGGTIRNSFAISVNLISGKYRQSLVGSQSGGITISNSYASGPNSCCCGLETCSSNNCSVIKLHFAITRFRFTI